jgi:hypothetical protein
MAVDPALLVFPERYLPNVEKATVSFAQWRKQQPGEYLRWVAFRDAVLRGEQLPPPSMTTRKGKELVAAGEEHMAISRLVGQITNPFPPSDPVTNPPVVPPPAGTLYFDGNMDVAGANSLLTQWPAIAGTHNIPSDYTAVTTDGGVNPVQGSRMFRCFVSTTNRASWSPASLQATLIQKNGVPNIGNETDVYTGWSTYVVPGYQYLSPAAHNTFMEYHGTAGMTQAPIHWGIGAAGAVAGQWYLDLQRQPSAFEFTQIGLGPHETGVWKDIILRTKWSLSASDGRLAIWMKNRDGLPMTDANKLYDQVRATWNLAGVSIYPTLGCYRPIQTNSATIYHDGFKIGNTFEVVDPGRYS